jgi:hypothetical protein
MAECERRCHLQPRLGLAFGTMQRICRKRDRDRRKDSAGGD